METKTPRALEEGKQAKDEEDGLQSREAIEFQNKHVSKIILPHRAI